MIKKIEHIVFFLLILSFPIQLGKHFWPAFSFVSGIRVDYLSPTLYLSDVLVFLLLTIYSSRFVIENKTHPHLIPHGFFLKACIGFILLLFLISIFSLSPLAGVYGIARLIEFMFLGRYVSQSFNKISDSWFILALEISILWTSLLGILQFVFQRSVGGLFYYVGERTFNSSTLGVATMSFHGQQILRPYSTFPHPNVYAFFLVFALLYVLYSRFPKSRFMQSIFVFAVVLGHIALFLTFSRTILLCYTVFLSWLLYTLFPPFRKLFIFLFVAICAGYLFFFSSRFTEESFIHDLAFRTDLTRISFLLLLKYPIVGVGLNNFFVHELSYQRNITPTLLQPVHNIYLLVAVETGSIGLFTFCVFLFQTWKTLVRKVESKHLSPITWPTYILLVVILIAGFFDHYFLTLQQGQLLFTFILGASWMQVSFNEESELEKAQGVHRSRNIGRQLHR